MKKYCFASLIAFSCITAQAAVQIVTPIADQTVLNPGDTLSVDFTYNVDDGNQDLAGIGFFAHYDSSFLSYSGYSDFSAFGAEVVVQPDQAQTEAAASADDGDAGTDMVVQANWAILFSEFDWPEPDQELPVSLVTVNFTVLDNPGSSSINLSEISTAGGYTFQGDSLDITVVPEPSTYAAISGLLILGATVVRRRRKACA